MYPYVDNLLKKRRFWYSRFHCNFEAPEIKGCLKKTYNQLDVRLNILFVPITSEINYSAAFFVLSILVISNYYNNMTLLETIRM